MLLGRGVGRRRGCGLDGRGRAWNPPLPRGDPWHRV